MFYTPNYSGGRVNHTSTRPNIGEKKEETTFRGTSETTREEEQEGYNKPEESYAVEDGIQSALEEQENKKSLQIKEEEAEELRGGKIRRKKKKKKEKTGWTTNALTDRGRSRNRERYEGKPESNVRKF